MKFWPMVTLGALVFQAGVLCAQTRKFDFGTSTRVAEGTQAVSPEMAYSAERGFGFEAGAQVEAVDRGGDALIGDFVTSAKPFLFSVALPEGNYRVTVTLGDAAGTSETTVKAELRRLMLETITTKKGKRVKQTFIVNVRRPEIAGGGEVKLKPRERNEEFFAWDDKLTLEFNGAHPCVAALEITRVDDVPTIFILGDSTVADQPREPFASWGQMLPRFFAPTVAIANHAESGEALATAKGARRLDKVLSLARPGDFVFIQFGHNDMKKVDVPTYKASLKTYTAALRGKGASVVLVTQMHRRTFEGAAITNSHKGYPDAVREVAKEESLPLVDLHAMSKEFYEALGVEKSLKAFKPGDGTHHSPYGAYELAKCIVESVHTQKLPVAKFLLKKLPHFDPAHPDSPETFAVPLSPTAAGAKPDGS